MAAARCAFHSRCLAPGRSNMAESITVDYLVVGAGAMGLAFADTIISDTNKTVAIIDRRPRVGGHWTTAYPFVRLHQPAHFYGVNSKRLDSGKIDENGWNKGLCELASRDEITAYFDLLMRQTFLPSGRVQYFPKHEYLGEGEFRCILSQKTYKVGDETCIVDATYSRTQVPSMRPPPYEVAPGIDIVTPNNLPDIARPYKNYTVVGAGKTGIDSCLWMLENGISPESITWIMPRDGFFFPRDSLQPGPEFAQAALSRIQGIAESTMTATSVDNLLQTQLDKGILLRLDDNVWPTLYHCATVSLLELDAIKKIQNIIRKGRITKITPEEIVLEKGTHPSRLEDTLYIDCSATAVLKVSPVPIFRNKNITLQPVRYCQQTFSAAMIAHIEATYSSSEEKNSLAGPVPMPNDPVDSAVILLQSNINQLKWGAQPKTQAWLQKCRLDYFGAVYPKPPEGADVETIGQFVMQMREGVLAMNKKLWELLEKEGGKVKAQLEGFDLEGKI